MARLRRIRRDADDGRLQFLPDAVGGLHGNLLADDGQGQRLKSLAAQLHGLAAVRADDGFEAGIAAGEVHSLWPSIPAW